MSAVVGLTVAMVLVPILCLTHAPTARHAVAVAAGPAPARTFVQRATRAAAFEAQEDTATSTTSTSTTAPPTPTTALRRRVTTATTARTTTTVRRAPATTTTARPRPTTTTTAPRPQNSESGDATWYNAPSGTCAHRSLPFGTVVKVTNAATGASTTCTVEDRGPYASGVVIDLSYDTFSRIADPGQGRISVKIEW